MIHPGMINQGFTVVLLVREYDAYSAAQTTEM
jgi:hypothetical protein